MNRDSQKKDWGTMADQVNEQYYKALIDYPVRKAVLKQRCPEASEVLEASYEKVIKEKQVPLERYDDDFNYENIIQYIIVPLQEAKSLEYEYGQDGSEYGDLIFYFME